MGMKGVRNMSRKNFTKVHTRDGHLWSTYEDAYENDKDILTELGKFLESYEQCLIQIKGGGIDDGYVRIFEKLKLVKGPLDSDHNQRFTDQILLEKIGTLMIQRKEFFEVLCHQIGKKDEYCTTRAWRRCLRLVTHMLFFGAAAAELACTVLAAVMAAPIVALFIAASIIPTLAGQHWILSWIGEYETHPDNEVAVIREMQPGVVASRIMLRKIQSDLRKVDIASLISISDLNCVTERIESHLKEIDELKKAARDYMSQISKARDVVLTILRASSSQRTQVT